MKYKEIDFKTLIMAFKHIKIIAISVVLFVIIGVIAGFLYVSDDTIVYKASADKISSVSDEYIVYDENYYSVYYNDIVDKIDDIVKYTNKLATINNNNNNEQIAKIEFNVKTLKENEVNILKTLIQYKYTFPVEFTNDVLEYYQNQIIDTERKILSASASKDFIMGIQGNVPEATATVTLYNQAFENASSLSAHISSLDYYNYRLSLLEDTETIQINGVEVLKNLEIANEKINIYIDELNKLSEEIAIETSSIIKAGIGVNVQTPSIFDVVIADTYTPPNKTTEMLAFVIFFGLVGVALGYLTALYKEVIIKE